MYLSQETLERKYVLLLVFSLNIVYGIVQEVIVLVSSSGHVAGIVAVSFFCLLGLPLVFLLTIFGLRFKNNTCASFFAWLLQLVAVVSYYYGNNTRNILHRFGDELGCGETCQKNNLIATRILLGCALVILHTVPQPYQKTSKNNREDKWWNYVLNMIGVLVTIDMICSVVAIDPTSIDSTSTDVRLSVPTIVLCTVIGWASIIINWSYTRNSIEKEKRKKHETCIAFAILFICLSLPFYLFSNNQLAYCAFEDASPYYNMTSISDNALGNSYAKASAILRLVLLGIAGTLVLLVTTCTMLIMLPCKLKAKTRKTTAEPFIPLQ